MTFPPRSLAPPVTTDPSVVVHAANARGLSASNPQARGGETMSVANPATSTAPEPVRRSSAAVFVGGIVG